MRPLSVLLLSIALLLGMNWFLGLNPAGDHAHAHRELQVIEAPGDFAVDLTVSFDAGPDEFALDLSDDSPSLILQLNGKEIMSRSGSVSASESPFRIDSVEGISIGANDFFIQASPKNLASAGNCVRVRVLRDNAAVADKTIWSVQGEIVQGTVRLEVPE